MDTQVAELNAKVAELEGQFNAAVEDKEAAIHESERCQLKLQLANRLINALASEGADCLQQQDAQSTCITISLALPDARCNQMSLHTTLGAGERWARTVESLRQNYVVLTGDMLLAAAFVSYAGPFTARFRAGMIKEWIKFLAERGIPMTPGITGAPYAGAHQAHCFCHHAMVPCLPPSFSSSYDCCAYARHCRSAIAACRQRHGCQLGAAGPSK